MRIVIFTHPNFINSQSMPKYATMLANGMESRGHEVEVWTPRRFFYNLPSPKAFKKWLGYIDQFLLFSLEVKLRLLEQTSNTLFVFADQALGPWIPLVSKRPFVVHCHDFLAQRSAIGEIASNKVQLSGKIYQKIIRKGFRKGKYFISVSKKTRKDLHRFLGYFPKISAVIYNGLNQDFKPADQHCSRFKLSEELDLDLKKGFILHVGGNDFYKNKNGVLKIYNSWRLEGGIEIPLLLVGSPPDNELLRLIEELPYSSDILFASNVSDDQLRLCYQAAKVLLFPSHAEGFGWPIAEAMASGCPVITTKSAPMTEVGGKAAKYVPQYYKSNNDDKEWIHECVAVLEATISLKDSEREHLISLGLENSKRFNTQKALDQIEAVYLKVLKKHPVRLDLKVKKDPVVVDN